MVRALLSVALVAATVLAPASSAWAKARLVAVLTLRSTPELRAKATAISNEIVARLAAIDGYDARLLSASNARDVDAAAAIGAEVYVVGQLVQDGSALKVSVSSYDVASDHAITSTSFVTVAGHIPDAADLTPLARDYRQVAATAPQSGTYRAQGSAAPSTTLVLVPFESPDNKDTALEFATTEFVKKMAGHGKQLAQAPVMDHVEAATRVAALCSQFNASGVLIGTARHEQRLNYLLGSYPTHAEVRVSLVDCNGTTLWKGFGTGDLVYYWANAGAAVSDALDKALDTIVSQFLDKTAAPQ
jgi:hypothetical protein